MLCSWKWDKCIPLQRRISHARPVVLTLATASSLPHRLPSPPQDLSRVGADRRAIEVFDQLRGVPERHPLRGLCDVYSYTAMVSMCIYQQDVDRALELVEDMRCGCESASDWKVHVKVKLHLKGLEM